MSNCFALSVTGSSHKRIGLPCQDASYCEKSADGLIYIAAADGLGSCKHSDIGAKLGVKNIIRFLKQGISMPESFEFTKKQIVGFAKRVKLDPKQMLTTLQAAVINPAKKTTVLGIVGDGGVVYTTEDNKHHLFISDFEAEYCNQTQHLLDNNLRDSVKVSTLNDTVTHLSLFTDGVRSTVVDEENKTPHSPIWIYLLHKSEQQGLEATINTLLNNHQIASITDDDLTMASYCLNSSDKR